MQLHISQKTGRGVPKITQKYGSEVYEFRENSIVVNIPFNWINVMGHKFELNDTNSPLTQVQIRILAEIRNNVNITKPKAVELLKVGKTTIDKLAVFCAIF